MSLIVQKFGGSSVRDTERLLRMAHIAKERRDEGCDVVVVLSAQGNTTDMLLEKAHELTHAPDKRELDALLASGEQVSAALGSCPCARTACMAMRRSIRSARSASGASLKEGASWS